MYLIRAIRRFFDERGFMEVETSILQVCPTMELHTHGFKTQLKGVDLKPIGDLYLHASPEFEMKKLLVAGLPKIYQICKTFRNAEETVLHSHEFTMIEWYRTDTDYDAMMDDCQELLQSCAQSLNITHYKHKDNICDPFRPWQRISVADAFKTYANIDLGECLDDTELFQIAIQEQGIRTAQDDCWDDLFFRVMAEKIEPYLGMDVPCILYDYPASMASLSRKKPSDPRYAERFELFVCGVELANAFSELTDAKEQRARFEHEMDAKQKMYGHRYPIDEDFLAALEHGMARASGIALGIDRLAMLSCGADDIKDVLWCA